MRLRFGNLTPSPIPHNFDEGITSSKRTMMEQMMNLDLKVAYDYGIQWIKQNIYRL